MTSSAPVERRDIGLRSTRGPVLAALMVTTGLIAIDSTILATAVPTIVADLGGFASFPWLFTVYLLTQAVTVPVYSRLADTVGRKPVVLAGITLFVLGSVACGLSRSMAALIAFRAMQGLGAGAVQPMSVTIVGDLYTVAERAKVQGYIGTVWGAAAVVGPTLGGLFSQFASWRWIFFVNVPLGLLAAGLLALRLHEQVERRAHRLDVAGGVLLTAGLTLVIGAVLQGGTSWAWRSWQSAVGFGGGAALLVAFVLVERRAAEPVLPWWVLSRPLLAATSGVAAGAGVLLMGTTTYVPTFLEAVTGAVPLVSGLALAMLTLGWPLSSAQSGRAYLRVGFRTTALIGSTVAVLGCAGLALGSSRPSPVTTALACFVIGLGLGFTVTPSVVAAQSSVDWASRGTVTGANMFARAVGSAVGVAVLGAVVTAVMRGRTAAGDPARFHIASTVVFWCLTAVAALTVGAVAAMPRDRPGAVDRTPPDAA